MASNIRFEFEHHQVSLQKLKLLVSDPVVLNTVDHIVELADGELGRAVCPIHNQPPQLTVSVSASGEMTVQTESCCDLFSRSTTGPLHQSFYETAYFKPRMKLLLQVMDVHNALPYAFDADEFETLLIGRSDSDWDGFPDVDLRKYGAAEKGVSRKHASILWHRGALHIVDEGSANGTCVNGERLSAQEPFVLHDGDQIQVGKLALQVMVMISST